MNDFEIREYEERIIAAINSEQLPVEIKRLIVWDIYQKVEYTAEDAILKQKKEKEESNNGNPNA